MPQVALVQLLQIAWLHRSFFFSVSGLFVHLLVCYGSKQKVCVVFEFE